MGAAATIFRDERGFFLGALALVIEGMSNPVTLEAIACREALKVAKDIGISRAVIASDCSTVVSDIGSGSQGKYGMVVT